MKFSNIVFNFNYLDLESAAKMYDKIMEIRTNFHKIPNHRIYKIKYENLANNFHYTLKELINFIGINWDKLIGRLQYTFLFSRSDYLKGEVNEVQ